MEKMKDWIKCSEQMPKEGESVLVYALIGHYWEKNRERKQYIAYWENDYKDIKWKIDCDCSGYEYDPQFIEPTHWMLLPKPPEE